MSKPVVTDGMIVCCTRLFVYCCLSEIGVLIDLFLSWRSYKFIVRRLEEVYGLKRR